MTPAMEMLMDSQDSTIQPFLIMFLLDCSYSELIALSEFQRSPNGRWMCLKKNESTHNGRKTYI